MAGGGQRPQQGRPSTAQKPPTMASKEGGTRPIIRES